MSKFTEITSGWANLIFASEEIEILALKRAKICGDCPLNVKNMCTGCGCYLPAKLRSKESKCPKDKWKNIK